MPTSRREWGLRAAVTLAGFAVGPASAAALRVGSALDRPALMVRQPERALVLGASFAGARLVAVGERGIVLVSDDGARSWRQVPVPVSVTLTAVRFADARRGFAVGHGGVALSTTDGGSSWVKCLDGFRVAQIALQAARDGGDAASIRQAERLVADGADKPFFDIHVDDAGRALAIGAYNLAFATSDGGATWQSAMSRLANPKALHLYAVRAREHSWLIAGEQGLILRSDDGGRSFSRLESPYKGSFFTAELPSSDTRRMALAGLRGNVWQSFDGGASWASSSNPAQASITGSALLAPGPAGGQSKLLFVNQAGQLLLGEGDGLVLLPGPPLPPLNGVLPLAEGRLLVLSVAGPILHPALTL